MPIDVNTLPQDLESITITTFKDIIQVLPKNLDYPINVWIGGKIAKYGQTSENLIFLVEQEGSTSRELKQYFEKISRPFIATVSSSWRDEKISAVRLYNEGRLIIDKETLAMTELPCPTRNIPILTLENIQQRLPKIIKWKETIYLTGSLVKYGWSGNDVDFMVDSSDIMLYRELRNYFTKILECKVDVGNAPMPEREPVYKYKLYEDGKRCLQ